MKTCSGVETITERGSRCQTRGSPPSPKPPFPRGQLSHHSSPGHTHGTIHLDVLSSKKHPANLHLSGVSDLRPPCVSPLLALALNVWQIVARPLSANLSQMILPNVDHTPRTTDLIPSQSTPPHAKGPVVPLVHWGFNGPGFNSSCRQGRSTLHPRFRDRVTSPHWSGSMA